MLQRAWLAPDARRNARQHLSRRARKQGHTSTVSTVQLK